MIIGNGYIASLFYEYFKDDTEILIFASGVSNSFEKRVSEFEREKKLILQTINTHPDKVFVYFSTCNVLDPSLKDNLYVHHKISVETMIKEKAQKFYIFRVPVIISLSDNPHLLLNYIYNKIVHSQPVCVYSDAYRYLIDSHDLKIIVSSILLKKLLSPNDIYNITIAPPISVMKVVEMFAEILDKKPTIYPKKFGTYYTVDNTSLYSVLSNINPIYLNLDHSYYYQSIKKRYEKRETKL